jgi:hypothetical protein
MSNPWVDSLIRVGTRLVSALKAGPPKNVFNPEYLTGNNFLKRFNEVKRAVVSMDWKIEPWAEEDAPPSDAAKEKAKLVSTALWRMMPDPAADVDVHSLCRLTLGVLRS